MSYDVPTVATASTRVPGEARLGADLTPGSCEFCAFCAEPHQGATEQAMLIAS